MSLFSFYLINLYATDCLYESVCIHHIGNDCILKPSLCSPQFFHEYNIDFPFSAIKDFVV